MAKWTRRPELFGFVPESDFERAAPLLAAATAETPVFTARLDAAAGPCSQDGGRASDSRVLHDRTVSHRLPQRASGGPPSGEFPFFQKELHELGDASVND
ncbi:hypothetical protein ACWGN9_27390 [Streptomyces sp. NPDC055775]